MSDTVKIIIEIPESDYKAICENKEDAITAHDTCRRIAKNGIPLDDVKAEIKQIWQGIDTISHNEYENAVEQGKEIAYENVLSILDNIGKAESEGDE